MIAAVLPIVYALNAHAGYRCRRSGACCTAGWTIPVEPHLRPLIGRTWLEPDTDGACPRFDRATGQCSVQRDHGEAALPVSCHQFPRRALVDDRGISVTLSHYCPTAATMLLDSAVPLTVVARPPGFPPDRAYEGLDARGEWPPLLRPDVLFDTGSYARWEAFMVETLGASTAAPGAAIDALAAVAEHLRRWNIHDGPLDAWTARVLSGAEPLYPGIHRERYGPYRAQAAFRRVADAVPDGLSRPDLPADCDASDHQWVAPAWEALAPRLNRYLGARAFASWTAYQGRGVRTQIAELMATAAVLRIECVRAASAAGRLLDPKMVLEAVRATDLLLVHLADRDRLVPWFTEAEKN